MLYLLLDMGMKLGYTSSDISLVIKSMMMRWTRNVARIEAMRNAYNILVEKPEWERGKT
jgi:hypothetical protein